MEISKYPLYEWGSEMKQICEKLFQVSPIVFVHYIRAYKDGTQACLCSNANWLEHYFKKDYHKLSAFRSFNGDCNEMYLITSELKRSQPIIKDATERFRIGPGIAIVSSTNNWTETVLFCSDIDYENPYQYLFNHLDILKKFILFFKDQGHSLLKDACTNKIILPPVSFDLNNAVAEKDYQDTQFPTKRYYINNDIYLTCKEVACLHYLSEGNSCKEIAQILHNSTRTITTHIENIKTKLDVKKTVTIVDIAKSLGII